MPAFSHGGILGSLAIALVAHSYGPVSFLPIPSFHSITRHAAVLIGFYHTSEAFADAISLIYGDEELHQKMLAVLGTVNLE